MRKLFFLALLLTNLSLCGCSVVGFVDQYILPTPEDTVQEIFEAGNDAMKDKNYSKAAKYFSRIKDEFVFSPYAIEAELSLADAYYLNEDYQLSAEAYKEFIERHPRHEAVPYCLYQLGASYQVTYTSIDRTTASVEEALKYYTQLVQQYPDTEYAKNAPKKIAECRKMIAQREIFIGNVFWKMDNYQAAWSRFDYVAKNFADVKEEAEYARDKAEAAYLKFRQIESNKVREKTEGSWKDWLKWL